MKKSKIFIACDTTNISKIKNIIKKTKNPKLKIGYKFGLEFLNSKNGRNFISQLEKKIIFADLKLHDIPNTCVSTIKAIKDLKVNYLTIHISSGLETLKACKKISGKTKLIGVTHLSNVTGAILPIKEITELAHSKDIAVLVDGCQGAPHLKLDMQDLDCDFYAISCHKMYGPTGLGVLYAKKKMAR